MTWPFALAFSKYPMTLGFITLNDVSVPIRTSAAHVIVSGAMRLSLIEGFEGGGVAVGSVGETF